MKFRVNTAIIHHFILVIFSVLSSAILTWRRWRDLVALPVF